MAGFSATVEWVEEWYNIFNETVFQMALPSSTTFGVSEDNARRKIDGIAKYDREDSEMRLTNFHIDISVPLKDEFFAKSTLLHEMIHIEDFFLHPEHFYDMDNGEWMGNKYETHGEWFQSERERINSMGMEGINVITGLLFKNTNIMPKINTMSSFPIRKLPSNGIKPKLGLRPTFEELLKIKREKHKANEETDK